jgi:hypothetical protein
MKIKILALMVLFQILPYIYKKALITQNFFILSPIKFSIYAVTLFMLISWLEAYYEGLGQETPEREIAKLGLVFLASMILIEINLWLEVILT